MTEAHSSELDVFYPIVPDADWAARLVPLGVRTLQLRVKDTPPADVRRQIGECLDLARGHGCLRSHLPRDAIPE